MNINKITITNFRMIDKLSLDFTPGFNLLLGDNGVGKTSVLEAVSVALAGFFAGIEDVSARNIYKDDVRYQIVRDSNGVPNRIYNTPVEIECSIDFEGEPYSWCRAKKDATGGSRTTINPRDILAASQRMANSEDAHMWPLISYQSAARHWISARSDADAKKRKQLHDRRRGYLGALDRCINMQSVNEWCKQMEWVIVKKGTATNYEMFGRIISKFMSYMNEGVECRVYFDVTNEKLFYIENEEFKEINDLSAGYQSILNMVIDLAYRAAILNPDGGEKIMNTPGIVLIDEIDSNLHPKWQWKIVNALQQTFPSVQFIAATHSPIIVSSCKNANIISMDERLSVHYIKDIYAYSVDEILLDLLGHHIRPEKIEDIMNKFDKNMYDEAYMEAKRNLEELAELMGENHPAVTARRMEYKIETMEE